CPSLTVCYKAGEHLELKGKSCPEPGEPINGQVEYWSNVNIQHSKMEDWYQDLQENFTTKRRSYLSVSRVFTSVAATQWSVVLTDIPVPVENHYRLRT
ncbi:hypothetical protein HPG69_005558, partial [Diceros bicornis minor]